MITGNELMKFEGQQVRMIDKDGEPYWVAKDVCAVLGIKNSRDAVASLDDDERDCVAQADAMGRPRQTTVVNEPGLYHLIDKSQKPEAKAFKRWIRHDVLPTIRKTGLYVAGESDMDLYRAFARVENRLAKLEENAIEGEKLARALPEPLGVLPEMTNSRSITKAARAFSQTTGIRAGAVWPLVFTEIEFRYGVRLGARKKKAGWNGSTLSYAIHEGWADKIYDVIFDLMKRYTSNRAA